MTLTQIIELHARRASAELAKASQTRCQEAAQSHFRLGLLHLECVRRARLDILDATEDQIMLVDMASVFRAAQQF